MFKALTFITLCAFSHVSFASQSLCHDDCTFVLKEQISGQYQYINEARANERMTPWSTFKIPNSLIALELGIVKTIEEKLSFDTSEYPIKSWWPKVWYQTPLSLKEAFKYSAVPIYQSIAQRIGTQKMDSYLDSFDYGNKDISSGVDNFWLNKSIKVSAKEQVDFLQRLVTGKLNVKSASVKQLKSIMLVEENDDFKLYAKTGGGGTAKNKAIGWYVGFVEKANETFYFALNIDGKSFKDVKTLRIAAVRQQLKEAGII